jgi:hypothetical protein
MDAARLQPHEDRGRRRRIGTAPGRRLQPHRLREHEHEVEIVLAEGGHRIGGYGRLGAALEE